MDFTMHIPGSEFHSYQLKVVSLAPIQVRVIGLDGSEVESFHTNPSHSLYGFKTKDDQIQEVICEVIPGVMYEFYPVVNAL